MKFSVILALVFFCALSYAADEGIEFEVGGKTDKANIQKLYKTESPDDSESGDGASSGEGATDDTESSGDDNGSGGSGEGIDTTPSVIVVTEKPRKTSKATTKKPKTSSQSTVVDITEVTEATTDSDPTWDTTQSNEIPTDEKPTENPDNTVQAGATVGGDDSKSGTVDFTVGIIVGVVVGAILAILVIVFLVYRLRKKDEGSYSLDEQSSQAFIRDEKANPGQGKEYFA